MITGIRNRDTRSQFPPRDNDNLHSAKEAYVKPFATFFPIRGGSQTSRGVSELRFRNTFLRARVTLSQIRLLSSVVRAPSSGFHQDRPVTNVHRKSIAFPRAEGKVTARVSTDTEDGSTARVSMTIVQRRSPSRRGCSAREKIREKKEEKKEEIATTFNTPLVFPLIYIDSFNPHLPQVKSTFNSPALALKPIQPGITRG